MTLNLSLLLLLWKMFAVHGGIDLYGSVWNMLHSQRQNHKITKVPLYTH